MIDTGPIANDQFKELTFQSSPLNDSPQETEGKIDYPTGNQESRHSLAVRMPDYPAVNVDLEMVSRAAELIKSMPQSAERVHKLKSGQMLSVEG